MKKSILFVAAILMATISQATEVVKTSVYENTFTTAAETPMDGTAMGTPAVTFSAKQVAVVGTAPKAPFTNSTQLQIQNKKATGGVKGQSILTAPIANFAAPFTAKLSEIDADSVVWMFNFRNNNQYTSKGFDDAQMGSACVLVCDNSDLQKGNGYAVTLGDPDGSKTIRLSRFAGGLNANDHLTTILTTGQITLKKYWTMCVVYMPKTNTWRMYWYEDQTAFVAPGDVTAWIDCGSKVDNTYVNNTMTTFGFLNNYFGNNDGIMYVKNYSIDAYKTDASTSLQSTIAPNKASKQIRDGKLVIVKDGVQYDLFGTAVK